MAMKTLHLCLAALAVVATGGASLDRASAAPVAITFDSLGVFHDPGGGEFGRSDLALGPDKVASLPVVRDFFGDPPAVGQNSFSDGGGRVAATFNPNFFGLALAAGTGISQFDPDNDYGEASSLTIAFNVDYLFDANGFGPWFEFATIPLISFAAAGDVVAFHLDATFTDVTGGGAVVLGPGLLIDFTHDGNVTPGLRTTVLSDSSGILAPIAGGSTINITGSIVFTARDPQGFASIFTLEPSGLNILVPEPTPLMIVAAGMLALVWLRRAAPSVARLRSRPPGPAASWSDPR